MPAQASIADELTTAPGTSPYRRRSWEPMAEICARKSGTAIVHHPRPRRRRRDADRAAALCRQSCRATDVVSLFDNKRSSYTRGPMRSILRLSAGGRRSGRSPDGNQGHGSRAYCRPGGLRFPRCASATEQCNAEPFSALSCVAAYEGSLVSEPTLLLLWPPGARDDCRARGRWSDQESPVPPRLVSRRRLPVMPSTASIFSLLMRNAGVRRRIRLRKITHIALAHPLFDGSRRVGSTIRSGGERYHPGFGRRPAARAPRHAAGVSATCFVCSNSRMMAAPIAANHRSITAPSRTKTSLRKVERLFDRVGLARHQWDRFPHEFSGKWPTPAPRHRPRAGAE